MFSEHLITVTSVLAIKSLINMKGVDCCFLFKKSMISAVRDTLYQLI